MLDFVPNHSAIDSPATSNPKLYIHAPNGKQDSKRYTPEGFAYGKDPYFDDPWKDVIQWNYWEEQTIVSYRIDLCLFHIFAPQILDKNPKNDLGNNNPQVKI